MWRRVELTNVQHVALVLEDSGLVVIHIEVVWRGEEGHDGREASGPGLTVHAVSVTMWGINDEMASTVTGNAHSTYPASCASWARMIDSNLFRSRNWHAA